MFSLFKKSRKPPENNPQPLAATVVKTPDALDILPCEIQEYVFSFFQTAELPATKLVSRKFCDLAKNKLREKFKDPEQIMRAISTLPSERIFPFIEACNEHLTLNFDNPHHTVICQALTTTDINKIDTQRLQNAIAAMSENKEFAMLLNGLQITHAGIVGDTTQISELLKKRSDLKPYVNLSGAELTGIDLRTINLDKVNFRKANLMYADFAPAEMEHANLDKAEVSGTDLETSSCVMQ